MLAKFAGVARKVVGVARRLWTEEPVLVRRALVIAAGAVATFGVNIDPDVVLTVGAVVLGVDAVATRRVVTPVAKTGGDGG